LHLIAGVPRVQHSVSGEAPPKSGNPVQESAPLNQRHRGLLQHPLKRL
jgi:hypothetical protein